jgi:surface polysaccharide O-acyltransferase-like enzyme
MAKNRLLYIDNLRILLITLVITVHLAVTYGGEGGWFYEEGRADTLTSVVLTVHNATAQSFFMGLLFFISAYLTVGSYDRKGPTAFLRDRSLRLGVPLLVYEFVIHPFQAYPLIKAGVLDVDGSFSEFLVRYYTSFHIGSGPLWFVETLLIFALVYTAVRVLRPHASPTRSNLARLPGPKFLLALASGLGVLSFIVRLRLPMGWGFGPLNLQLPFFVQYIAMLAIGVIAYRGDWLARLPRAAGWWCLGVAAFLSVVVLPATFVLGGALQGNVSALMGGWHWQAFAYAMWEQTTGLAMMVGLLVLFRERFNRQGRVAKEASAGSYTAYIIHAPVLILFTLAVRDVRIYPLLKFALVALVTVPMTFALGAVVRRLPLARRIL